MQRNITASLCAMTILPPNCHLQCLPHRAKLGLNAIYWIRCHLHFPNYRGSRYTRELLDICPVSRKCQVFTASLCACYHDIIILYADEHVLSFMTVRGPQRPSSGHHTLTSCSDGLSCSSDVFFSACLSSSPSSVLFTHNPIFISSVHPFVSTPLYCPPFLLACFLHSSLVLRVGSLPLPYVDLPSFRCFLHSFFLSCVSRKNTTQNQNQKRETMCRFKDSLQNPHTFTS